MSDVLHTSGHDHPESEPLTRDDELANLVSLAHIESEVARQGKAIRRTQTSFVIFAVAALVISLVTLIAVASKLGTKDIHVTAVAPAASSKAPAAATPAPLPHKVGIGLKEFKITPTSTQAGAGKVTFNVRNAGTVTHEFVVVKTNKPAGGLLKGARADESGNVGETGDLAAGSSKNLTLTLKPGHYALICNLPGHYKAGQFADFTVK
jgi:uncharacterized cupredoxin-like copper-binding protein